MTTVLITYPTPPSPSAEPRREPHGTGATPDTMPDTMPHTTPDTTVPAGTPVPVEPPVASVASVASEPSVASTTAGIDEAIAATIADELSLAGHHVTCRPCVATPVTGGYELVVDVDRLRVTHRGGPTGRGRHARRVHLPDRTPSTETDRSGESTIPMTWGADWRAVDAWARTVGDSLVRYLELRVELTRVRSELEHCRSLLQAATSQSATEQAVPIVPTAPTPPLVAAPRPAARESGHGGHRHRRLSPAGTAREV
ncbi:hypothetical protein GCM10009740_23820 [Terrabacter terrae]|uniref:Uncharacterized protein n=1 Tax=Terrabacter terrae TaxID=318434 RepID=A0ABN2UBY9_9MICO